MNTVFTVAVPKILVTYDDESSHTESHVDASIMLVGTLADMLLMQCVSMVPWVKVSD